MLVYRNDEQVVDAPAAWRGLVRRVAALTPSPPHDHVTTLLIELGEFESGIADHLFPERDAMHRSLKCCGSRAWRRAGFRCVLGGPPRCPGGD